MIPKESEKLMLCWRQIADNLATIRSRCNHPVTDNTFEEMERHVKAACQSLVNFGQILALEYARERKPIPEKLQEEATDYTPPQFYCEMYPEDGKLHEKMCLTQCEECRRHELLQK